MKALLLATALTSSLLMSGLTHALVVANNVICVPKGSNMVFQVIFDAAFENAVIVKNSNTGKRVRTFNNFYGSGAGGEWQSGAGSWKPRSGQCYSVSALHKAGPANPNLPWAPSALRRQGDRLGFEDGADGDYNDAVLQIIR